MDTRFAITEYPDAAVLTAELDALIKKPIYSINRTALKKYEEEYFEKKCAKCLFRLLSTAFTRNSTSSPFCSS